MTTNLTWRSVNTLVLAERLIPDPNASHNLLDQLRNVRVAIEGSFLHVDPRQPQDMEAGGGQEFDVHVVPASAVKTVTYRDVKRRGNLATFP
ncbi:hypothetical protein OG369_42940 [Streptomyces sp. NBC_01221]|uniref:hypothetical protein n=1 Tax=Streptomyces sp. NBC_01221 TaxID=2903782 RepID=UPI0022565A87|nr:hypothetical protein [Streptomyces sp. NBC_01221]MCX4792535.1 hypothetical protein [Streptomyces sp. NBC_01221]